MFATSFDMNTSLESNYEPRFLAVGTGWSQVTWMSALRTRTLVMSNFSNCCANNKKSNFTVIQFKIVHETSTNKYLISRADKQFSVRKLVQRKIRTERNVNLCIVCITMNSREISFEKEPTLHIVNKMGPRQEPWGILHSKFSWTHQNVCRFFLRGGGSVQRLQWVSCRN